MTRLMDEVGYTEVCFIDGSGSYRLPLEAYEQVLTAWKAGLPFLSVRDWFGAPVVLKGSRIEAIGLHTAETLAARAKHADEQRKQDAIGGGL